MYTTFIHSEIQVPDTGSVQHYVYLLSRVLRVGTQLRTTPDYSGLIARHEISFTPEEPNEYSDTCIVVVARAQVL